MSRGNWILGRILETIPWVHFFTLSTSRNHLSSNSFLCRSAKMGANRCCWGTTKLGEGGLLLMRTKPSQSVNSRWGFRMSRSRSRFRSNLLGVDNCPLSSIFHPTSLTLWHRGPGDRRSRSRCGRASCRGRRKPCPPPSSARPRGS